MSATWEIRQGDALAELHKMPAASVHCCITSPPYYELRDDGQEGQIGLEPTPDAYVAKLLEVFREVKRVLRDDGTLWLNMGDSYAGSGKGPSNQADGSTSKQQTNHGSLISPKEHRNMSVISAAPNRWLSIPQGVKGKDLLGIPWLLAFALRADGWYLRSEIIWAKPNPMPESVTDRPTKAHETVFLLSKAGRYYYDADAIRQPQITKGERHEGRSCYREEHPSAWSVRSRALHPIGTNKRSVWTVATQPYPEAHFATFPPKLIEPMVLAGCPAGGTVVDPFAGSGTTLEVAVKNGRSAIGIELNADYCRLTQRRLEGVTAPLFA